MSYSTGVSSIDQKQQLHHRIKFGSRDEVEIDEIIEKTSNLKIDQKRKQLNLSTIFIKYLNPLLLTFLSAFIRLYKIEVADGVIWDEAHFGKFGSHYLKREFYFDVHPPLGKLLVGLSGYLCGYDGNFEFESGNKYKGINYVFMRVFNCFFGILVTPLVYKTSLVLGYNQLTCWLISLLVVFEQLSLTLSKFILLDSFLLFFTVFAYYCLINLQSLNFKDRLLTKEGIKWCILTGVSIGCVCSVKWVGLFVTLLIGGYIIVDLLYKFYQTSKVISYKTYILHWLVRIITLIFIPLVIYMTCFKIHFSVLNHTGPGDGSISTLLQASLIGNDLQSGPRSVAFGSLVTIRSQGLSPNLLHSHPHTYPEGSQQQQVTTYGYKDANNEFLIEFDIEHGLKEIYATLEGSDTNYKQFILNKDTIRLIHKNSNCYLRANSLKAPITDALEVSCFGETENNELSDEWIIEIQHQDKSPSPNFQNESINEVHPISTSFRLKHKQLGCYLATTGKSLPSWGYQQGEVVCKYSLFNKDKNTWWNIEKHSNEYLELPIDYIPPKPKFWKEFLLLNYGMMASNNALMPDGDKFDKLSSEWWEWPIMNSGLRMCGWGATDVKYFLLGNPVITWASTASLGIFLIYLVIIGLRYQRQSYEMNSLQWNKLLSRGLLPLFGWFLHYFPFIIMGRVKYLHHYAPAIFFAIFVTGFLFDKLNYLPKKLSMVCFLILYIVLFVSFWHFKPLAFGMEGPSKNFAYLKWSNTWMI
ncbi:unnamed protein product [Candida verbasci]|uniref:Dolichyl-phosphate-mannose--protein mannosyltransferase n=1 Tax=Candida verbasci TaxID=1227364 RepID=A0A9W4TZH7_9ASCO|nr:unnamed protein product [Candida verbasci]